MHMMEIFLILLQELTVYPLNPDENQMPFIDNLILFPTGKSILGYLLHQSLPPLYVASPLLRTY